MGVAAANGPLAAHQRTTGTGRLRVEHRDGENRMAALWQEGAAKLRFPQGEAGAPFEAVTVMTAGGLTGGDRMAWDATAGPRASVSLTTQASEKVYRAGDDEARVDVRLVARECASLAWLPQETILFDGSALSRTIEADLAADARLLLCESLVFGRREMGETVRSTNLRDRWRIRREGTLVHAEDLRVCGDATAILAARATGGGATAFATVLLVDDNAGDWVEPARRILRGHDGVVAGVSAWTAGGTGKLLARMAAKDGYCLRKAVQPLLGLLNGAAGLPKIWAT